MLDTPSLMSTRADFDFIEKIGRGASSVVYKARRKVDGQLYCVKEVDLSVVTPEEESAALQEVFRSVRNGRDPVHSTRVRYCTRKAFLPYGIHFGET